jgi:hypothetical protein
MGTVEWSLVDEASPVTVKGRETPLTLGGGTDCMRVLVDTLRSIAEFEPGSHAHVEHYPGHPWLDVGATPLVIHLVDA